MKAVRLLLVVALAAAVTCLGVYASGTSRGKDDVMKKYPPGSSQAFAWVAVQDGLISMKKLQMPGMIYYYHPENNVAAYMWEVRVFDCPRFATLKDKFIIMRCYSTHKLPEMDVKIKIPKKKTGVLFLDYTGKKIKDVSRPPSPSMFSRLCQDAAKKNRKAIAEAKEEKK